jgi:hypothetical protein
MKNTVNARIVILSLLFFSVYDVNKTYAQGMGIGIATPISVLHVYENTANVSTTAGLTIEQNSTGDAVVQYLLTGGQRWVTGIDNSDGDKFKISSTADVGGTPRLTIQTTGEVGVGIQSPLATFHAKIPGGNTDDPAALIQVANCGLACAQPTWTEGLRVWNSNDNGRVGIGFIVGSAATLASVPDVYIGTADGASSTNLRIATNVAGTLTDRIFITGSTGNVGLGTSAPGSLLNLNGSVPTLTFNHSSGLNQDNTGVIYFSEDATAGFKIRYDGTLSVDKLHFTGRNASVDSDWLTIVRSNGNVGIGITSPASTLHVNGAARFGLASTTSGSLVFNNSSNANTLTLQTGTTSSSYTITLPAAQGAANTTLVNNGSGVLSWSAATGGTTRYTIATGATNTFYSDSYIQFRWNTTSDVIQFSPIAGHTGWWDLWQVFEITPDALESGTANSGADDIDAATAGTWYNINSSQTEGEYGPGGAIYITKEDSNSRPVYKIEYVLHGTYMTFLVTVYP